MKTDESRIHRLVNYVQGVLRHEDGKTLYLAYRQDIESVTPQEVFEILYRVWSGGVGHSALLSVLDKIINIFYKSLSHHTWTRPEPGSFLDLLDRENAAMTGRMDEIKTLLKSGPTLSNRFAILGKLYSLAEFDAHYVKKENILFPFMEQKMTRYQGVAIMWALHDETRACLKNTIRLLEDESTTESEINTELGRLFFAMIGLVQKETLILFPCASEALDTETFREMNRQSLEYGFPFLDLEPHEIPGVADSPGSPTSFNSKEDAVNAGPGGDLVFKTGTGDLHVEQLMMILNALPVDMTYVDEYDRVRYFSRPKDRLFPRSLAIIGRDVRFCHPPQSVGMVLEIIEAFRSKQQDKASFWIDMKGRKILIQYFALYSSSGDYRGVLEVSQEITEIQQMTRERRLLEWKA